MPNFGFSAFLKIISLSERSRRSSIKQRLQPSAGGYDFHRSLRLQAGKLLAGQPLAEALAAADAIVRAPEKNSVKAGLTRLSLWRRQNPGAITVFEPATYNSPNGIFSVTYTPNFGIILGDFNTAIHIWNTQRPPLTPRQIYSALSLFRNLYSETSGSPDDIGLLSLRNSTAYRLGEATDHSEIGKAQVVALENIFRSVSEELGVALPSRSPSSPLPPEANP